MVCLGYMKYINDRYYLGELAKEFGEFSFVITKPHLVRKVLAKFNERQEQLIKSEISKFDNSYIKGKYGLRHPVAIERMNRYHDLESFYHPIKFKEAKKMLNELIKIKSEKTNLN